MSSTLLSMMSAIGAASGPGSLLTVGASSPYINGFTTSGTCPAVTTSPTKSTFVIYINVGGTTPPASVTDSKSNTYTLRGSYLGFGGGSNGLFVYDCVNGVGGSGHTATVTFAGNTALGFGFVEIVGGGVFGTIDTGSHANATTVTTSTISTSAASLVLSFMGGSAYITQASITDAFSHIVLSELDGATYGTTIAIGAFVQSSAGSINDVFTQTTADNTGTLIAAWH